MRKKSFSLVLLMALIGTVASLGAQDFAQSALSPLTSLGNDIAIGGSHTLYTSLVHYNNTIIVEGGGNQPLDEETTVTCPGPGDCLIEFDRYVEIADYATGNRWAICSKLDGVFVTTPECPYQGYTHVAGEYPAKVGSFVQFAGSVSPGTHAVRTFIYSDNGLTVGAWSILYRVYTP